MEQCKKMMEVNPVMTGFNARSFWVQMCEWLDGHRMLKTLL